MPEGFTSFAISFGDEFVAESYQRTRRAVATGEHENRVNEFVCACVVHGYAAARADTVARFK